MYTSISCLCLISAQENLWVKLGISMKRATLVSPYVKFYCISVEALIGGVVHIL